MNVFFQNWRVTVSCLNVCVTVLKLNYWLVHRIACCFHGLLDFCNCQMFEIWTLNCATVDTQSTMLSLKD